MSASLLLPLGLIGLLSIPISLLADRHRQWIGGRKAGIAVRAVALALLSLGLARPVLESPDPKVQRVVVLDRSSSVGEVELPRADGAALVVADAGARVLSGPGGTWADPLPAASDGGSDLLAGVELALGLVPRGVTAEVVLVTDGAGTDGGPDALRTLLDDRGARLTVIPAPALANGPRIVSASLQPPQVARGGSGMLRVVVAGGQAGASGELSARLGAVPGPVQDISADAGTTVDVSVPIDIPADAETGVLPVEVSWAGDEAVVGLTVRPPRRALIVGGSSSDGTSLAAALEADGFSVARTTARNAAADLSEIDLVVLADAPVGGPALDERAPLTSGFLAALDPWVREGGGLLVLGGPHAYDLGGYEGSALDALLPVEAAPPGQERDLRVELVIALDKSASMAAPVATGTAGSAVAGVRARVTGGNAAGSKIRLVSAAAGAALGQLRDQDRFSVLAVDSEARWALPPTPGTERDVAASRLGRLKAGGGGIFLVEALRAAQVVLQRSDAPIRHLILFADTADIGQKEDEGPGGVRTAEALVEELAASGVTLSVIGVGARSDRDREYLQRLAKTGGGRFRLTSDFRRLRALFIAEAEQVVARSLEEETDRRVRSRQGHPGLSESVVASLPRLTGVNRIEARGDARTLWTTDQGEALLVTGQVGLGEVMAFAADSGEGWARGWPRWSGYGRLWTGLARALARPDAEDRGIQIEGRQVRVRMLDAAGIARPEQPERLILDVDSTESILPLEAMAPGVWAATLPVGEGRPFTLRAEDAEGALLAEFAGLLPLSPERAVTVADTAGLEALAAETQNAAPEPGRRRVPLGPWLLGAALVLLPLDAFLRRGARRD